MVFTSWVYVLFLPIAVLVHRNLRGRSRKWFLLAASYYFYAVWDVRFLGLIWLSTLTDYVVAQLIPTARSQERRRLLVTTSVVVNLLILGLFKYWNFFADSAAQLLEAIGLQANPGTLSVVLPVGVSFYTFQSLSYTIDVYRGRIEPQPRLDVFALYVAFFPQLVAGPIERAERLMPQLADTRRVASADDYRVGLWLIGRGFFRKLVIADAVAPYVETAFSDPSNQSQLSLFLGVIGFSLQIYGDFTGYTDIARGSARLMGIDLVQNFRQPYTARSITEFWQRWHMSLSAWLRDYLYIPLGGSRTGRWITYRNLMLTMLLGGLWHGAAWTFVVWGGLHGALLVIERMLVPRDSFVGRHPAWAIPTAVTVALLWIPFRADGITTAWDYLSGLLLGGGDVLPSISAVTTIGLATLLAIVLDRIEIRMGDNNPLQLRSPLVEGLAYGTALVLMIVMSGSTTVPFIYFQF